jgi:hypothetical protein
MIDVSSLCILEISNDIDLVGAPATSPDRRIHELVAAGACDRRVHAPVCYCRPDLHVLLASTGYRLFSFPPIWLRILRRYSAYRRITSRKAQFPSVAL